MDHSFKLIDWMLSRYPIEAIIIQDELTFSNHADAMEFCRRIRKYDIRWTCFIRADMKMPEETLSAMKASGCAIATLGIESADSNVLKSMRKGTKVEQVERIRTVAARIGLPVIGWLIFGDQVETMETALKSINWRVAHQNDRDWFVGMHMIYSAPGSYMYKIACEKGIVSDKKKFLRDAFPPVNLSKMTDDEYNAIAVLLDVLRSVNRLKEVQVTPRNDFCVALAGKCPHCSHVINYERLELFVDISPHICPYCGRFVTVNAIEYFDFNKLSNNISSLLDGGGAALWAITFYNSYHLLELVPSLKADNVKIECLTFLIKSVAEKENRKIYTS